MAETQDIPQLTDGFVSSRSTAVASAALIYLGSLSIMELPDPIPVLGVSIPDKQVALTALVVVLCYAVLRMIIEWFQSDWRRRKAIPTKIDAAVSIAFSFSALTVWAFDPLSWSLPAGFSYISGIALVAFGLFLGSVLSASIWSLQFVRSKKTAITMGLPRLPVATRSSFRLLIASGAAFFFVAALAMGFNDTMHRVWLLIILGPAAVLVIGGLVEIFMPKRRLRDGRVVKKSEFLATLQCAFDAHDARYQVGGWDKPTPLGFSPLYMAAQIGHVAKIKELLAKGDSPDQIGQNGWTPLMIAVAQQHVQAAKLLIEAGGNPNVCNSIGRTPLMFASHYGNKPLVKLLLASGADPNLRGFESESLPLASAAMSGHSDIVRLLLDAGADPMLLDGSGKTPLDLAEGAGHGEIAATLRLKTLRKR